MSYIIVQPHWCHTKQGPAHLEEVRLNALLVGHVLGTRQSFIRVMLQGGALVGCGVWGRSMSVLPRDCNLTCRMLCPLRYRVCVQPADAGGHGAQGCI